MHEAILQWSGPPAEFVSPTLAIYHQENEGSQLRRLTKMHHAPRSIAKIQVELRLQARTGYVWVAQTNDDGSGSRNCGQVVGMELEPLDKGENIVRDSRLIHQSRSHEI